MAKSIKKNLFFNLVYQIVALLAPIIVTPYISRTLGVENVGLYSYAFSITSYFILIAVFGTDTYGQRAIGYEQQDIEARSRIFWEVFILRLLSSILMLIVYIGVSFAISNNDNILIFMILACNIVNVIFDINWFMQGMEEFVKIAMRSIFFRILSVILTFVLVKDSNDLWIYIVITLGTSIVGNLSIWLFLPRYICKVNGIRPFREIKTIFQMFLPSITMQLYLILDKSMIGWFSEGYNENGYYEQADKIIKMALTAVTALGIVMIPRIANTYKKGDTEQIKKYIYMSYRYVWMIAIPIMFGLISVSSVFVPIFFGGGYEKCSLLIPILSGLTISMGLSNVTGMQYFVSTEKQNIFTLTVVIGAFVNVILNAALIPFFASVGAALASLIAESSITIVGLIYVRRKQLYALTPIITCSWKYWVAGIVMFGAVFGLKYTMPVAVWSLIVLIIVGVAVYAVMLFMLRDAMVVEFVSKFVSILKSKINRKKVTENTSGNNGMVISQSDSDVSNEIDIQNNKEAVEELPVKENVAGEDKIE